MVNEVADRSDVQGGMKTWYDLSYLHISYATIRSCSRISRNFYYTYRQRVSVKVPVFLHWSVLYISLVYRNTFFDPPPSISGLQYLQ